MSTGTPGEERLLGEFLESSPDLVFFRVDREGRIVYGNPGFLKAIGTASLPPAAPLASFLSDGGAPPEAPPPEGKGAPITLHLQAADGPICTVRGRIVGHADGWAVVAAAISLSHGDVLEKMSVLKNEVVAANRELVRKVRELEEAREAVRTLRGMLPICSSCKKVRDDKGYWSAIESYVSSHSEAEFSHGFCPDCLRKLYPEFTPKR